MTVSFLCPVSRCVSNSKLAKTWCLCSIFLFDFTAVVDFRVKRMGYMLAVPNIHLKSCILRISMISTDTLRQLTYH